MKKYLKSGISLLMALLMALSFAACGGGSSSGDAPAADSPADAQSTEPAASGDISKISLLMPGDEVRARKFMEPAMEQFHAENPDIQVEVQYKSWADWIATYPSIFQSDTQANVIMWWTKSLRDEYVNGKLLPITDYVDTAVLKDLPQEFIDSVKVDDTLYLLPVDFGSFMMFYRRDIMEEAGLDPTAPPQTWDEFIYACEQIAANTDVYPLALPGKAGVESCQEMVSYFMYQTTGQSLLNENNQVQFNTEEGLEGLKLFTKLLDFADPKSVEYSKGDCRQLFIDGQVAFNLVDSVWCVPGLRAAFGDDLDNTVAGISTPPVGDKGKYNLLGVNGWVIAQEENAEASGRLVEFLYKPEMLFQYHDIYGAVPFMEEEFEMEPFTYDYWQQFLDAAFDYTQIYAIGLYHPAGSALYPTLEPIWQELMMGNITEEEAMEQAVEGIEDVNSRYGIE